MIIAFRMHEAQNPFIRPFLKTMKYFDNLGKISIYTKKTLDVNPLIEIKDKFSYFFFIKL